MTVPSGGIFVTDIRHGIHHLAETAVGSGRPRSLQKDVRQKIQRGQNLGKVGDKSGQGTDFHAADHDLPSGHPHHHQRGHVDGKRGNRLHQDHHFQCGNALIHQSGVDFPEFFLFIFLTDEGLDHLFIGDRLPDSGVQRVDPLLHYSIAWGCGFDDEKGGDCQKGQNDQNHHGDFRIQLKGHDQRAHQHDRASEKAAHQRLEEGLHLSDIVGNTGDQRTGGKAIDI